MYSPHSVWQSQTNGSGADDLYDGEWPHEAWSQFPPDQNVLLGEPHALTNKVRRSGDPSLEGQLLHPGCKSDQVGACDPPSALAGEQGGLVPQTALKG